MRSIEQNVGTLPTGAWLAQQRERLSQTLAQVATALHQHPSTVRALERNNRVIPPGWNDGLRALGLPLPSLAWPRNMPPYFGSDLERDMNTCTGLRHSRYWLSKQLYVSEEAVVKVIRGNLLVPHDWLLKLAELGANVPPAVQTALHKSVQTALHKSDMEAADSAPKAAAPDFSELLSQLAEDERNHGSSTLGPAPQGTTNVSSEPSVDDAGKRLLVDAPAEERKQQSITVRWSQEEGLYISASTPLVEELSATMKELLVRCQNTLMKRAPSPVAQKTAERSRG